MMKAKRISRFKVTKNGEILGDGFRNIDHNCNGRHILTYAIIENCNGGDLTLKINDIDNILLRPLEKIEFTIEKQGDIYSISTQDIQGGYLMVEYGYIAGYNSIC